MMQSKISLSLLICLVVCLLSAHGQTALASTYTSCTYGSGSYDTCDAPGAPTNVSVTVGNGQATISFSAPSDNGGLTITSYTVVAEPGSISKSGSGSPITMTGLTNGVAYTFVVYATNSAGNSVGSTATSPATPESGLTNSSGSITSPSTGNPSIATNPTTGNSSTPSTSSTKSSTAAATASGQSSWAKYWVYFVIAIGLIGIAWAIYAARRRRNTSKVQI